MAEETDNYKNKKDGRSASQNARIKDVRLPVRAAVVDKSGVKIGKIRGSVWYDNDDRTQGTFVKEDDEVHFHVDYVYSGYVDKNNNIFNTEHDYLATVRYVRWWLIVIPLIALAVIVALSSLLAAIYLKQTGLKDYAPVLFVCEEDGTDWNETENLSVFYNDMFGDKFIAPGISGTYRFYLESKNNDPVEFSLTFSAENEYGIELVYRLKRDGSYLAGNEGYVDLESLTCENLTIENNSSSLFEIEWYWRDNDPVDTVAGENSAIYVLHINFEAQVQDAL